MAALAAMREEAGRVLWGDLLLITLAMVGARTLAMASNRLIDRELTRATRARRRGSW